MEHLKFVSSFFELEEEKAIVLLHDVLEDTDITEFDLLRIGISKEIINVIKLLTHKKGKPYMDYIKRIKRNRLACKIKIVDIQHNMDLSRIPNPTKKDYARIDKYKKALAFLES